MKRLDTTLYGNRWKPIAVLIAIILALPFFVHSPHWFTVLILIGLYSIITIGLSLLLGYAGQISLGHAAFFGIGAYVSGIFTTKTAMSPWLVIIIGMVGVFILAYAIGIPILKLKGHFLALATVGINIIVYVLLVGFSDLTGGPLGLQGIPKLNFFGLDLGNQLYFYYFVWTIVILVIFFSMNIVRSHVGRLLRSIGDSEIATQTLGVDVAKTKVAIFAISAAYASLAGSLYAHFINFIAPPTFNVNFSILLLIMVMVGGVHSIWGALLGTATILFLQEFIRFVSDTYLNISGQVEIVVYGFIVILVMIFIPKGFISILAGTWKLIRGQRNKITSEEKGIEHG
jgi:branched-chain amino acid transport system permease protein